MDGPKHKTLESKHEMLKEAFKKLYCDYEALKTDLSSKIEEYAKLHEENTHLKHSYDLLADEISQHNQKNVKHGASWTNPLTLIKGSQSNESETYQKLNEEISQLKLKLENLVRENEGLNLKNVQTTRDLEDNKAKHNVIVTELKDRLIALESILKDLQEQLNNNENKLLQYTNEIKSLNTEIDNKSLEINTLNKSVESLKKEHSKDLIEWKLKLNEKFKFDLRRNSFINLNNIYQNGNDTLNLDVHYSLSNYELFNVLISSFGSFFNSWKAPFKFIQCSLISNDLSTAIGSVTQGTDSSYVNMNNLHESDSTVTFNSWDDSDETDVKFSNVFDNVDLRVLKSMDRLVENINGVLVSVCDDFQKIINKNGVFDSEQFNNISTLVKHLKEFFKLQRIYFCIEEYIVPYKSSKKDNNKNTTRHLINLLGDIKKIVMRFYCNLKSTIYLVNDKKRNQSRLLLKILTNECGTTSNNNSDISGESTLEYSDSPTSRLEGNLNNPLQKNVYNKEYNSDSTKSMEAQHKNLDYLIKNLFTNINDVKVTLNEIKESLSHRLCYPKVYNGMFLPFTGGTNQMVQLTSSLSKLENELVYLTEMRIKSYLHYLYTSLKFCSNSNHFNFKNYNVKTHSTIEYINKCNEMLLGSKPRIKLSNLQKDLYLARKNENELSELKLKFANMQELLEIATYTSKKYEDELERLKSTNELELICERIFNKLQVKFANGIYTNSIGGKDSSVVDTNSKSGIANTTDDSTIRSTTSNTSIANTTNDSINTSFEEDSSSGISGKVHRYEHGDSIETATGSTSGYNRNDSLSSTDYDRQYEELDSYKRIKKLNGHIKYLLKTITSLEDSNKQLKLALEVNRNQYLTVKENEDSIHRNYNEQLVLMSEHISELNNAILNSEYKIAELTQTKVSCPSCGFNNTLGSMMGVDDKGRCSSCRCIVIFSSD